MAPSLVSFGWLIAWMAGAPIIQAQAPRSVVVELFTSEGCSSCPPADEVLAGLQADPPPGTRVLALGFHVDYWDRQGWKDPWSQRAWTDRQSGYARAFKLASVYTPQLVVDGGTELIGSNDLLARQRILEASAARKVPLSVARSGSSLQIRGSGAPAGALLRLFFVQAEGRSTVLKGENQGKSLVHVAIVQSAKELGSVPAFEPWERYSELPKASGATRVVVVLQVASSLRILGAGDLQLAP